MSVSVDGMTSSFNTLVEHGEVRAVLYHFQLGYLESLAVSLMCPNSRESKWEAQTRIPVSTRFACWLA